MRNSVLLSAVFAAALALPASAGQPTPLTMQIDRTANGGAGPFTICANILTSAPGCMPLGTMDTAGQFAPANALSPTGSGAGLTGITSSQVGAVSKTGDAMTGPLSLIDQVGNPTIYSALHTVQNSPTAQAAIYNPGVPPGYFVNDNIASVVNVPSAYTGENYDAFGYYVLNNAPRGTAQGGGVGLFGVSACVVGNSSCWGLNPTVTSGLAGGTVGSLPGVRLIGAEFDISGKNPADTIQGVAVEGSTLVQPSGADGFSVGHLGVSGVTWTHGFVSSDGAAQTGMLLGSTVSTAPTSGGAPSQPVYLNYFQPSGTERALILNASNDAFNVSATGNADGLFLQTSNTGAPTIGVFGTNANINLNLSAAGTGAISAQSLFQATDGLSVTAGPITVGAYGSSAVPASALTTMAVTDNQSNGGREGAIWNLDPLASPTLNINQVTGSGTYITPLSVLGAAGVKIVGGLQLTGEPVNQTAAGSACFTSAGVVFEKTTSGSCI